MQRKRSLRQLLSFTSKLQGVRKGLRTENRGGRKQRKKKEASPEAGGDGSRFSTRIWREQWGMKAGLPRGTAT